MDGMTVAGPPVTVAGPPVAAALIPEFGPLEVFWKPEGFLRGSGATCRTDDPQLGCLSGQAPEKQSGALAIARGGG